MTTTPPPPPSSPGTPPSGGTPPAPPSGGTPPGPPPPAAPQQPPASSGPTGQPDGRKPWWSAGRVMAAIVLVLVLMGGAGTVGFFAGAAWSGAETIGQGIVDDISEDFPDDSSDDPSGGTDEPATEGDAIQVGDTVTGTFNDNAVEHTLTIDEPTEVTVELRSDDFDTTLTVLDESGDEIAYNDDIEFGEDRNSRVEVSLEPGTYGLVVDAFGSGEGSYELAVR